MVMAPKKKKTDYNKRMRVSENEKLRKTKQNLIIKNFEIRELMDETGEVNDTTYIQISFEGILINLSIATAMKLGIALRKDLNIT
jgi:hypothetical protein